MEKQITYRLIDSEHQADINIKNEPFLLSGRMIPSLENGVWTYRIEKSETVSEMVFPDENYNYESMSENSYFLGAYDGDRCVGLAIMQDHFLKHMYLYDLKVSREYRGRGVGTGLIEEAVRLAKEHGYRGVYTQGQDNNLAACQFYLKNGFVIGGFDNHCYDGTGIEGDADIIFYRKEKTCPNTK